MKDHRYKNLLTWFLFFLAFQITKAQEKPTQPRLEIATVSSVINPSMQFTATEYLYTEANYKRTNFSIIITGYTLQELSANRLKAFVLG